MAQWTGVSQASELRGQRTGYREDKNSLLGCAVGRIHSQTHHITHEEFLEDTANEQGSLLDGALSLVSSEDDILSDSGHVNLVLGSNSTSHLQVPSSTGIGSALMFCVAT